MGTRVISKASRAGTRVISKASRAVTNRVGGLLSKDSSAGILYKCTAGEHNKHSYSERIRDFPTLLKA